jgi:hypothetical protein
MLQCWSNEDAIAFLKDRLRFERDNLANDDPAMVIGHLTLQGAKQHGTTLEEHAAFEIIMPFSAFEGFDAVLMGHIHQFQVLSREPLVAHVGSMERTDFGEAGQPKVFAFLDTADGQLSCEFVPLPVKSLHDIEIDRSSDAPAGMMAGIKRWLRTYGSRHPLAGSIARVAITVGETAAHVVDTGEIMRFLLNDLGVSNCVSVHTIVVSKRQLRDATITEKADPRAAFNKWLELNVADQDMREELAKAGLRIIDERGRG